LRCYRNIIKLRSRFRGEGVARLDESLSLVRNPSREDIEGSDRTAVRAEIITSGPKHDTVEQIRLSLEPGIAAVSWSVVPTMME
jgi:hypothetical protein